MTMPVRHLHVLAYRMHFEGTVFVLEAIDVHGSVATLGSNVFVQRVPRDTLHVMVMFGNFVYAFAYS